MVTCPSWNLRLLSFNVIITMIHVNSVNHIVYIFVCIHVIYFCLWPYLCVTLYLPVKSMKVFCFSTCPNSFVHKSASVSLTFHLYWEIWFDNMNLVCCMISTISVITTLVNFEAKNRFHEISSIFSFSSKYFFFWLNGVTLPQKLHSFSEFENFF